MRFVVVAALCVVALGGCKSTAERATETADTVNSLCRINHSPGTEAFKACQIDMAQKLIAANAEERSARANALGDASASIGAALLAPRPQNPSFTCRSNTFAGTTTTNCQ